MKLLPGLLCFSFLLSSVSPAAAAETILLDPVDAKRDRTVPIKVYLPAEKKPTAVILYSHGLGGSRNTKVYLGEHWAEAGYVAVFVQHAGSDEEVWKSVPPRERLSAMKKAAGVQAALDRYADIPFVIDQLEKWSVEEGHPLQGRLDLKRLGMCGHSFGAHTTQAMMGQKFPGNRTVSDSRIRAFFAMSPSPHKRLDPVDSFGHIEAPVLLMTGTKDASVITPDTTPEKRMQVYGALPEGDKYHLVFEGAEHNAFGDNRLGARNRIPHHHPAIQMISTRFWDAYLRENADARKWLQSEKVREDAKLVEADLWEWK